MPRYTIEALDDNGDWTRETVGSEGNIFETEEEALEVIRELVALADKWEDESAEHYRVVEMEEAAP